MITGGGANVDDFTISDEALEALTGNITLQANRDINVNAGLSGGLTLTEQGNGESVTFRAGQNIIVDSAITTNGADINFTADDDSATGGFGGTGEIDINANISTAGAAGVAGDINLTVQGGTGSVELAANLQTDGGNVTINAPVVVDIAANSTVTIDTEDANDGSAGNITLTSGAISADAADKNLSLNTSTTAIGAFTGGTIALGTVDNTGGGYLNGLTVDSSASGGTDGAITLNNDIDVDDDGAGNASSVTLIGDVRLAASIAIDTEQGNTAGVDGGSITLTNANISGAAAGLDLALNTSTGAAGRTGGAVSLGTINSTGGGNFLNDVNVSTSATNDGTTTLNGNISLDTNGGDLSSFNVNGGGDIIVAASTEIDTEDGNDANAGLINLGISNIYANADNLDLVLDTASTGNTGGAVTVSLVDDDGGNANFLQNFSIDAQGTADGQVALANNISVDDDGAGNAGSVTIAGDVRLATSIVIDTQQGNTSGVNGGTITLNNSNISASTTGVDLELNTSNSNADGGAIEIGVIDNSGGNFVNDLTINTSGSGSAGTLTLHDAITLDDNAGTAASLTVTGNGDIVLSNTLEINTEDGNSAAGGAVNFNTSNIYADETGFTLTVDTQGTTAGGAVGLGLIDNNVGANEFLQALSVNSSGTADGDITLANNVFVDGGNVTLDGDVIIGASTITIDTADTATTAGQIILTNTNVGAGATNRDLILDASATTTGGAVSLGQFNNTVGF